MRHQPLLYSRYIRGKLCIAAILLLLLTALTVLEHALPVTAPAAEPAPLAGMTILLDAGHGGYDGGACGKSGVWEKEINLAVALQTRTHLQALGATVVMTRTDDSDLCTPDRPAGLTKKRQDMEARIALATSHSVDMVLSIHMNYYRDRSQAGPQVFYRAGCDSGRLLAGCMQESMNSVLAPEKPRSALPGDYFILQLDVPSVLVECGFLSNPGEEGLLLTDSYRARVAEAIAQGVLTFAALPV